MVAIAESTPKQVRMANLAMVGSHSINGVSAIHTNLTKASLVPDFYLFWPERVDNKTNGHAAAVASASQTVARGPAPIPGGAGKGRRNHRL